MILSVWWYDLNNYTNKDKYYIISSSNKNKNNLRHTYILRKFVYWWQYTHKEFLDKIKSRLVNFDKLKRNQVKIFNKEVTKRWIQWQLHNSFVMAHQVSYVISHTSVK